MADVGLKPHLRELSRREMSGKELVLDKGDPTKLFRLLDEIAVGSYGRVYKVGHSASLISSPIL